MASHVLTLNDSMRRTMGWSCIGALSLYAVADRSLEFLLIVGLGTIAAWFASVRPRRPAPRPVINLGLLGVVGLGVLQTLRLGVTVSAFAYFIGLLLVVKLFDLRRASDWGQALVLVTGTVVAAVLTDNSMFTGLLLVVNAVLLLRTIMRYHMLAAAERAWGAGTGVGQAQAMSTGLRQDLRSVQFGAGFAIFLAGTLVFLILPRNLGAEAFGNWGSAGLGQSTGFADEVSLGQPGLISQSPTPVMDITVVDRSERNIGRVDAPPLYLRGAVLLSYESGRWTRSGRGMQRAFIRPQFVPEGTTIRPWITSDKATWDTEMRVSVRHARNGSTPLFTLWEPHELRMVGSGQTLSHDLGTGLVNREGPAGRVEYTTRSLDPRSRLSTLIAASTGQERGEIEPTDIDPAVASYAVGLLRQSDLDPDPSARPIADDFRVVRVFENHLQATFDYTLEDQPTPPGRDATEWFLTERKTGHCEYFASALTLMCRSVGIDARVVTGYVASDFNEVTGQYLVRESGAHAWVEAEVAPGVWLTFDGTPRAEFQQIHQPPPTMWRKVAKIYETVEHAWITGVVAYDSESRRRVMGRLATDFGLQKYGGRMIRRLQDGGGVLVARAAGIGVVVFVAAFLIGMVLSRRRAILRRMARRVRAWWAGLVRSLREGRRTPDELLHDAITRSLERHSVPRPSHRPMRSHLERVRPRVEPAAMEALASACDLVYASRFAGRPADRDTVRAAIRRLRASENRRSRTAR